VNRASITKVLRDATEIVDEVMPWEWPVRSNKSVADRTELRKAALRVVFDALIAEACDEPETPKWHAAPEEPGKYDDAADEAVAGDSGSADESELLKPSEVADMCHVTPQAVTDWDIRGILRATRTPGGHRRYPRADVEAFIAMPDEERTRLFHPAVDTEDIVRMRDENRMTWKQISQKTGLSRQGATTRYTRWKEQQARDAQPHDAQPDRAPSPRPTDPFQVMFSSGEARY